jgi:histone-lysine N-methyltransferase SETMAR
MLCIWWDIKGVVHFELLPPNQTITQHVYSAQLDRLQEQLRIKRSRLVNRGGVVFQHDNARPHVTRLVLKKIHDL